MKLFVDGEEFEFDPGATVVEQDGDRLLVRTSEGTFSALAVRRGDEVLVSYRGRQFSVQRKSSRSRGGGGPASGELRAPMPGQIVDVRVAVGDGVSKGQVLVVLEAMKTQQPFVAPFDGKVSALPVTVGQTVGDGALLVACEPAS
jgi:acetyl/propionyl-CoA carboxylase alpha subunit